MRGLNKKSGVRATVILLFSGFMLAGLTTAQAHGQSLDSPLYDNSKTEAVESMNDSSSDSLVSADAADTAFPCFTVNNCPVAVPAISPVGVVAVILTLIGGGCWIIRKKCS